MAPVNRLTDAQLVAQVLAAGNQAQYRLLVERHQQAVFNAAYRLSKSVNPANPVLNAGIVAIT